MKDFYIAGLFTVVCILIIGSIIFFVPDNKSDGLTVTLTNPCYQNEKK